MLNMMLKVSGAFVHHETAGCRYSHVKGFRFTLYIARMLDKLLDAEHCVEGAQSTGASRGYQTMISMWKVSGAAGHHKAAGC